MHILDNPPHYYYFSGNANAYAAEPACKDNKDSPFSGLMAWGCQAQKNFVDATNSTITTLTPAAPGSMLDNSRKAGGTPTRPPPPGTGGTPASKNCGGCSAGNIGCEIGKLSCEFTKALGDAGNSTRNAFGGSLDFFGKYWPFIAAGGALVIVILLIKRR